MRAAEQQDDPGVQLPAGQVLQTERRLHVGSIAFAYSRGRVEPGLLSTAAAWPSRTRKRARGARAHDPEDGSRSRGVRGPGWERQVDARGGARASSESPIQ